MISSQNLKKTQVEWQLLKKIDMVIRYNHNVNENSILDLPLLAFNI